MPSIAKKLLLFFSITALPAFATGRLSRSSGALDALVAKRTVGYTVILNAKGDLSRPKEQTVSIQRGWCYVVEVRLEKGAAFSKQALVQDSLNIDLNFDGESNSAGPGPMGPGAVADFGCLDKTRKGLVVVNYGQALGTGSYALRVYARAAKGHEVESQAADLAEARRAAAKTDTQMKTTACQACVQRKADCVRGGRGGCDAEFFQCVRSSGYAETACGG